jgi:hypothetical protein
MRVTSSRVSHRGALCGSADALQTLTPGRVNATTGPSPVPGAEELGPVSTPLVERDVLGISARRLVSLGAGAGNKVALYGSRPSVRSPGTRRRAWRSSAVSPRSSRSRPRIRSSKLGKIAAGVAMSAILIGSESYVYIAKMKTVLGG